MRDISERAGNAPYFLLGIGLGPSNLALAVALEEENALSNCLFLERQNYFGWHEAMKLPGTDMQVAFMKDLATPRNPTSKYSFLSYLKEKERLSQFINLRRFYPTRFEFNDYMKWVSEDFSDHIQYGTSIDCVEPAEFQGTFLLKVSGQTFDGKIFEAIAKNICIATGHQPKIPDFAQGQKGNRLFHTSEFLPRISRLKDLDRGRSGQEKFLVVGAGQSAAETAMYLTNEFPAAQIDWCFRNFALHPMDDSHFVNEVFMEHVIDDWFGMTDCVRKQIRRDLHYANYSAIDTKLIQEIYTTAYDRQVEGQKYLNLRKLTELVGIDVKQNEVSATLRCLSTNRQVTISYRAVVLATGYNIEKKGDLWSGLIDHLELRSDGQPVVDHRYRVATKPHFSAGIYTLGNNEDTHGMGDTLLSNIAVKAGNIAKYILESTA